jgi:long-chain acyl-CoA synthetase
VALVVANVSALKDWARSDEASLRGLPGDTESLLKDPRVVSLFKKEIDKHGAGFKGFERIGEFALIVDDFTTDNGMLTPSLKLKRRKVIETYGSLVEQLYARKKGGAAEGARPRA